MVPTLLTCLLTALCCAAEPTSQPASRPASGPAMTAARKARLQEWITQLGDSAYETRENATRQLQTAEDAVPMLAKTYAVTDDAEVIERIELIARRLFHDVISRKWQPGFLGVELQLVTEVDVPQIPKDCVGIKIANVVADTPAAKAGLKVDDVIVRFAGKTLGKDMLLTDFTERVMAKGAGAKITVQVARGDKLLTLTATLASRMAFIPQEFRDADDTKFRAWWQQHFRREVQDESPDRN